MMNVTLHRSDPGHNMQRYYRLDVQPDLFGHECLLCEWGRIGHSGQTRIVPYPTFTQAEAALEKQKARKEKKGYFAFTGKRVHPH